jgi:hypothetical protein
MKLSLYRWMIAGALLVSGFSVDSTAVEAGARDAEADALITEMHSRVPERATAVYGTMRIREGRRVTEVPLKYTVVPDAAGWRGIYQTQPAGDRIAEELTIVYRPGEPNTYIHQRHAPLASGQPEPRTLTGEEAFVPFASSDYWLADLGMEFFHWPMQRLVRDARITMRKGRACKVIESTNPNPAGTGYSRVVSWVDAEYLVPIYAEAFDQAGKRFKLFSLKGFKRVNGSWEPKELELANERNDTRTRLEFTFESGQLSSAPPGSAVQN